MMKSLIWFISMLVEQINKFLFGLMILIILFYGYSSIRSYIKIHFRDISCATYYPIKEKYTSLNKDHQWQVEKLDENFTILSSHKDDHEEGLSITLVNEIGDTPEENETYIYISNIIDEKRSGLSLSYTNQELSHVSQEKDGKREGIDMKFYEGIMPSIITVYHNDHSVGEIYFWEDGSIRDIQFDAEHKFDQNSDSFKYPNGTRAYMITKEQNMKYRVIKNTNGKVLLKFPINNDPCKIQLFQDEKKVNIPLYLDTKEVIEIFKNEHAL